MSKYEMLDDRIVVEVTKKPLSFAMMEAREDLCGLANSLVPPNAQGSTGWRLLDRRLQALKKKGRIEHHDGYWRSAK